MINCGTLPCRTKCRVRSAKLWDRTATTELCRHGAVRARLLLDRVDIALDPWVALKVSGNKRLCRFARDPCTGRKPKVAHPVGDAEVDHLRHRALVVVHLLLWLAEHARGGGAMNILARCKRLNQVWIPRHMREDAQLNLAVVGGNEPVPLLRDEGVPNLSTQF